MISKASSSSAERDSAVERSSAARDVEPPARVPASGPRHEAIRNVIAACASFGAVFALSTTAGGAVRVVLAVLLLVATPTAPDLARRLATNLVLAIGWLPVLMWAPAGLPGGRMAWLLGLVAAMVVAARTRPGSAVRLRPFLAWRHLALLVAPVAAGVSAWPLFTDRPSERVLAGLMRGWDHAGHFSMFFDQRAGQGPPPWGPAPDGSGWEFGTYAQWVHTLMAELAELRWGPSSGTALEELALYAHLNGVLFVVVATLLATTVLAVAEPAGEGVAAAMAVGVPLGLVGAPGARMVLIGYATYLVVTVTVACVVALACTGAQRSWTTTWVLSAGVVASSAWMFLLPLASVVAALHLFARLAPGTRSERMLVLALGLATAVPVMATLAAARAAKAPSALNFGGEVTRLHPILVVGLLVLLLLIACSSLRWRRDVWSSPHAAIAAVALVALVELGALGYHQLHTIGRLEYYWWKLACATTILAIILLTLQLTALRRPRCGRLGVRPVLVVWCMALGLLGPGVADRDLPAPTPVALLSLPVALTDTARLPQARALVSVAERPPCGPDVFRTMVLLPSSHDRTGQNSDQWFHSLHHARSLDVAAQELLLTELQHQPSDLGARLLTDGWALWAPRISDAGTASTPAGNACLAQPSAHL